MNVNKISHTSWNCKYHVVFAPKYRRKAFYGSRRLEIGAILRKLCNWKGIKYNRGGSMCGSRTYVNRNTAEILSIRNNGVFEREK